MLQIKTAPKRLRIRSAFDPRWLFAFALGLALSMAYYGLLIWGAIWLVRRAATALGFG